MTRLVINSVAELKTFQRKLKALAASFPIIQKNAVDSYANDDVLKQIKTRMEANDFSDKIIDATFVGPVNITNDKIQIHYISDYESDTGFDVSNAREEGTQDHFIRPRNPNGVLRWEGADGQIHFSKGHEVSGIERLLIIEKTINEKESGALTEYGQSLAEQASKILGV